MRKLRYIFIISCSMLFVFAAFSMGMAQSVSLSPGGTVTYNRFLASDLGFTAGGKDNEVFTVTFGGWTNTDPHHLYIEIKDSDFKVLLSGTTNVSGNPYDPIFSGKTLANYEILDVLGGRFTVSTSASEVRTKILKTGEIPEGTYEVKITLKNASGTSLDSDIIYIKVEPAYLQTIYPVDTSVTKAGMNFILLSRNVNNMELHVYSDPGGNDELTGPTTVLRNVGQSFDASRIASLLTDGGIYYWQIHGYIDTTHGEELVKSQFNQFLYFEDAGYVKDLGLSDVDSNQIMDKLFKIVLEIVNKRAANSLKGFEVERVLVDGNVVASSQEIMAILKLIEEKEVTVNSAAFR